MLESLPQLSTSSPTSSVAEAQRSLPPCWSALVFASDLNPSEISIASPPLLPAPLRSRLQQLPAEEAFEGNLVVARPERWVVVDSCCAVAAGESTDSSQPEGEAPLEDSFDSWQPVSDTLRTILQMPRDAQARTARRILAQRAVVDRRPTSTAHNPAWQPRRSILAKPPPSRFLLSLSPAVVAMSNKMIAMSVLVWAVLRAVVPLRLIPCMDIVASVFFAAWVLSPILNTLRAEKHRSEPSVFVDCDSVV